MSDISISKDFSTELPQQHNHLALIMSLMIMMILANMTIPYNDMLQLSRKFGESNEIPKYKNLSVRASPREPHALAWGPSSFHTKTFRVERTRLKTMEINTDSL